MNDCFENKIDAVELTRLIETKKISSQHVITYRLLYNHKYEETINKRRTNESAYFKNVHYEQY